MVTAILRHNESSGVVIFFSKSLIKDPHFRLRESIVLCLENWNKHPRMVKIGQKNKRVFPFYMGHTVDSHVLNLVRNASRNLPFCFARSPFFSYQKFPPIHRDQIRPTISIDLIYETWLLSLASSRLNRHRFDSWSNFFKQIEAEEDGSVLWKIR